MSNSTSIETNFNKVFTALEAFKKQEVDLVVFPECSLSGFSAQIRKCTDEFLAPLIHVLSNWVKENKIAIILPTAVQRGAIYNMGFFFNSYGEREFYKIGLTPSEKKFFTAPDYYKKQVFEINDFSFMPLICREAEGPTWKYFAKDDIDFVLWPAYWGWTAGANWGPSAEGGSNAVFENMKNWQVPLIQSGFAFNDVDIQSPQGPCGLNVVVNRHNELIYRGPLNQEKNYVVCLTKESGATEIEKVYEI